jgi:hypothetical protein
LNFSFSSFFLLFGAHTRENFIDERRRRRNREEKNLKKKSKEERRERERERKSRRVVIREN